MPVRPVLAAMALLAGIAAARAAGRDLDAVMGYQLVTARTIEGYIDNDKRHMGFGGCEPGQILVFSDHSGVRCKASVVPVPLAVPKAWVFARSHTDLKLCVGDELYEVEPLH
jgi:hypothetical protein